MVSMEEEVGYCNCTPPDTEGTEGLGLGSAVGAYRFSSVLWLGAAQDPLSVTVLTFS